MKARHKKPIRLSAMTLVIIYLRAKIAGPGASPAIAEIDEFIEMAAVRIKNKKVSLRILKTVSFYSVDIALLRKNLNFSSYNQFRLKSYII